MCELQIVKHTTIGQVIQGNRFLQALWLEGNPCFKPPTYDSLIKVLGRVSRCSLQGFKLDIDGTSVTVDDRISAVRRKRLPISLRSSPVSSFVEVPEASTEVTAEWPASLAVASTLDAVQYSDELVERLRLALTVVDTARSSGEDTSLDLSASKLVYIADLVSLALQTCCDNNLCECLCRRGIDTTVCP